MKLGAKGKALIQSYEKCRLTAYKPTPNDVWTIGWGHTGKDVYEGLVITQARADELFAQDVAQFEKGVTSLLKVPVSQNQFDALVSFAFNVGLDIDADTVAEGLGDSTLLKKVNSSDPVGAAEEFPKWNKQAGKILAGLTRRRLDERSLFLTN